MRAHVISVGQVQEGKEGEKAEAGRDRSEIYGRAETGEVPRGRAINAVCAELPR